VLDGLPVIERHLGRASIACSGCTHGPVVIVVLFEEILHRRQLRLHGRRRRTCSGRDVLADVFSIPIDAIAPKILDALNGCAKVKIFFLGFGTPASAQGRDALKDGQHGRLACGCRFYRHGMGIRQDAVALGEML
jgi:hypothetical protein